MFTTGEAIQTEQGLVARCRGCKEYLHEDHFAVDKMRSTGRRYKCRACSSKEFQRWKETPGYRQRLDNTKSNRVALKRSDPVRLWAKTAVNNARRRAKAAGLPFTIDVDWLVSIAPKTCVLFGTKLNYAGVRSAPDIATVDRIDNRFGYTPDNCWVISMLANRLKSNATLEQIETLARNLRKALDDRSVVYEVVA